MANAGVVGMAEVVTPNSTVSGQNFAGSAAMWSYVWVGAAALFLLFVHLGLAGRAAR